MTRQEGQTPASAFEDRVVVITGAASGIGLAIAKLLATTAQLVLADIDIDGVKNVAHTLGGLAVPTDVADQSAMERLARSAPDARLVCLNAGVVGTSSGAVWETSPEEWDRVLRVNVGGVVNGLRAFVPRMLEAGQPASVLITASLAGLATWPGGGPYAASKHAVVAVAEQAALALAGSAVTVTVFCPALVKTAMSDIGDDPLDVAAEALAAVAQRRFTVLPPEWEDAVRRRGDRLATGAHPEVPNPTR